MSFNYHAIFNRLPFNRILPWIIRHPETVEMTITQRSVTIAITNERSP